MTYPLNLAEWMGRHGVTPVAMAELQAILAAPLATPDDGQGKSEAWAQSAVRLEAPHRGCWLGRNNVGQLLNEAGRPVRYGLANDSAAVNARVKSADLIGWRRLLITPAMVGTIVAQFLSREIKRPGWTYNPNDEREAAQMAWNMLVLSHGGDAAFATGPGTL